MSRLESLVFLWPRRVYRGSCKTPPFRKFLSRFVMSFCVAGAALQTSRIACSTLHTPRSTLHTPHSTLYTSHSTLHSTLYTPHFKHYILQFSWQAQRFGCVHRHFAWQAQHFGRVVLRVFANRIVRAASSGGKVQIPWQAAHFVRCDEN